MASTRGGTPRKKTAAKPAAAGAKRGKAASAKAAAKRAKTAPAKAPAKSAKATAKPAAKPAKPAAAVVLLETPVAVKRRKPAEAVTAATLPGARRGRHPSAEERVAAGKAQRGGVPLEALGAWDPAPDRPDPVSIIVDQERDRLQQLVPVRHARMLQNAFAYYRGAPAVMAYDLGSGPSTDLHVQLCGDAHLLNFGVYGSPERALVFDVNDFDETLPGPFEWDVKRLVASLVVSARGNGFSAKKSREIALAAANTYRTAMAAFASADTLKVWYTQIDAQKILASIHDPVLRRDAEKAGARATSRDSAQAAAKLTTVRDGRRTIDGQPPLIVPFAELEAEYGAKELERGVRANFTAYRRSLRQDVAVLVHRYQLIDMALKVVGVGSVGTRCYIALMQGRDVNDVLFLQVKEAVRSVLEPYQRRSRYAHQGERVVVGQRLTQSSSDIFLGWSTGADGKRNFYWRQLRDWKGSAVVETMDVAHLTAYGVLCAWTLAKGHARSGDPLAISAYLGKKDRFDRAMVAFGEAYADQNEDDYAALKKAATDGRIEVASVF